ncbi:MAG: HPr-rel-A system PqqD family peptide chaperone [Burkholderiaceae bacterium]
MCRYRRTDHILIEPVGHLWVAFSPVTGETTLLNDESAAILEVLESGPADSTSVCAALVEESDGGAALIENHVETCWTQLIQAGLVRIMPGGYPAPG